MKMRAFDYVIIGAGSAGCVVAHRLAAAGGATVLLLEAGGRDWNPMLRVPLLTRLHFTNPRLNWGYETGPQSHLHGRRIPWPRGKVLGGSSSINGMTFVRGHPSDFDAWRQSGLDGWGYDDVLPYFRRMERHVSKDGPYHGPDGALAIESAQTDGPLDEAFLGAGRQAGYPATPDFNGAQQEGFGLHDFNTWRGRRQSTATAFLRPALKHQNLTVETHALATRIRFEGLRSVGLDYLKKGRPVSVRARREIILCGGAVNSPVLLMQSGLGDGEDLRHLGIDVIAHLPGVGRNLQDHLGAYVTYDCLQPITLNRLMRPDRAISAVLRAFVLGTGPGSRVPVQACAFLRSWAEPDVPDIQVTLISGLLDRLWALRPRHGFLIHVYQLRPQSRGRIRIRSADPAAKPLIEPNYLSEPADLQTLRRGVRIVRDIASQPSFDPFRGTEISPGGEIDDDTELDDWIRRTATTSYHAVGTCSMGIGGMAVVDAQLCVRGVDGLRVADASVMPAITGGNTNAPTIMIAEKASDMILGKPPLVREDAYHDQDSVDASQGSRRGDA